MEIELTAEEKLAIKRVECSSKWDSVSSWVTLLLPCFVIGAIGFWNDSILAVACAGLTIVLIVAWNIPRQIRDQEHLKSAVMKLKLQKNANQQNQPIAEKPGSG